MSYAILLICLYHIVFAVCDKNVTTSKQYTNDMQDNSLKVPCNKEGINQSHLYNIVCFASYSFHPIIIIFVMLLFGNSVSKIA